MISTSTGWMGCLQGVQQEGYKEQHITTGSRRQDEHFFCRWFVRRQSSSAATSYRISILLQPKKRRRWRGEGTTKCIYPVIFLYSAPRKAIYEPFSTGGSNGGSCIQLYESRISFLEEKWCKNGEDIELELQRFTGHRNELRKKHGGDWQLPIVWKRSFCLCRTSGFWWFVEQWVDLKAIIIQMIVDLFPKELIFLYVVKLIYIELFTLWM